MYISVYVIWFAESEIDGNKAEDHYIIKLNEFYGLKQYVEREIVSTNSDVLMHSNVMIFYSKST